MPASEFLTKTLKLLKSHSPEILTALGITGVVTTSYLTAKAGKAHNARISKEAPDISLKEEAKLVWTLYIPPVISGAVTIGCIIGASKANSQRTAAAVTAYSLTERAFSEYKEKVVEQIGKGKERKVRDDIAQDKVTNNPPVSKEIIITGKGDILCCELYTHRYFKSDMETLRKAQNDLNELVINNHYVTLSEFYDIIDMPYTSMSSNIGWDSNKLMELIFTTTLSEGGEPCLAFDYNYTKPLD